MIEIKNVNKTFDDTKALDNLTLTVRTGSIYGLMGLNGAGKTTIINHIAGFLHPDDGEILIDYSNVFDNEEVKDRVQIIPDELYFFKGYSLNDMAKYYHNIYSVFDYDRFYSMIKDFGLDANKNIGKFSKGMKKQAQFALSMSTHPDYLILDEPVDGLDPIVRHKLWGYIMDDVASKEMTVLVSSHNAKEMGDACDYIGIIHKGHIIYEGSILDLGEKTLEELFIEKVGGYENEK